MAVISVSFQRRASKKQTSSRRPLRALAPFLLIFGLVVATFAGVGLAEAAKSSPHHSPALTNVNPFIAVGPIKIENDTTVGTQRAVSPVVIGGTTTVPHDASAVELSVDAVGGTNAGELKIYPAGDPTSSYLQYLTSDPGVDATGTFDMPAGTKDEVTFANASPGSIKLLVTITAYTTDAFGPAGNGLTGSYPNPSIAPGAVTPGDLNDSGAVPGQVLGETASGPAWTNLPSTFTNTVVVHANSNFYAGGVALANAISSAQSHEAIIVEPGVYEINTPVTVPAFVSIIGFGRGITIVDSGISSGTAFTLTDWDRVSGIDFNSLASGVDFLVQGSGESDIDSSEIFSQTIGTASNVALDDTGQLYASNDLVIAEQGGASATAIQVANGAFFTGNNISANANEHDGTAGTGTNTVLDNSGYVDLTGSSLGTSAGANEVVVLGDQPTGRATITSTNMLTAGTGVSLENGSIVVSDSQLNATTTLASTGSSPSYMHVATSLLNGTMTPNSTIRCVGDYDANLNPVPATC